MTVLLSRSLFVRRDITLIVGFFAEVITKRHLQYVNVLPAQVVYVTATFPYLVLVIFFFRGITLHGFERGLEYLFVPEVILFF